MRSKKRILILATDTNVGKTYVALRLLEHYATQGLRVGAIKPIETGVSEAGAQDGRALWEACHRLNPNFASITLDDVVPITYPLPAAPAVASGFMPTPWHKIEKALDRIEEVSDLVVIESAGGLLTPLDDKWTMVDLATKLSAVILLVVPDRLGTISHTSAALEILSARALRGLWCVNHHANHHDYAIITRPWFEHHYSTIYHFEEDLATIAKLLWEELCAIFS